MSDRATIDIDCERGVVSVSVDTLHALRMDNRQVSMTRASMITDILRPLLSELMCLGTPDLEARVKSLRIMEMGLVTHN